MTQQNIVCFEYKVKPFSQNKISYLNELSLFCQKKQINLFPNHKDNSRVVTHEEEILSLSEKKNYTEEEIFSSHKVDKFLNMKRNFLYNPIDNRTNSNNDFNAYPNVNYIPESTIKALNMNQNSSGEYNEAKEILPGIIPELNEQNMSHVSEKEEEIDRLIMQLTKNADNKTKSQLIKKLVSYYKKNKTDESKISSFYVKLSSQIQENPSNLHIWMDYEYLRSKIDSLQFAISKEVTKFLQICTNLKLKYDAKDFNDISAKYSKQTIINKISEYIQFGKDEEIILQKNPILIKILENYDPTKIKKKNISMVDKIIKKIKEIFDKFHFQIKENTILSLFFNINNNPKPQINNIHLTPSNHIIVPSTNIKVEPLSKINTVEFLPNQDEGSIISNNSLTPKDIIGLDKLISLPTKSRRYKIKQFSLEDFCNEPPSLFNLSSQYSINM